jgi:phosphatidate phosphatase LPIN
MGRRSVSGHCKHLGWIGLQLYRYITRNDGSPLMHALILWRNAALLRRARGLPSRPASPFSDEDEGARSNDDSTTADGRSDRSKSPSPEEGSGSVNGKPTSSSWVKWWSRSRKNQEAGVGLRASTSAPLEDVSLFECSAWSCMLMVVCRTFR